MGKREYFVAMQIRINKNILELLTNYQRVNNINSRSQAICSIINENINKLDLSINTINENVGDKKYVCFTIHKDLFDKIRRSRNKQRFIVDKMIRFFKKNKQYGVFHGL